jgi:hypothetical protein
MRKTVNVPDRPPARKWSSSNSFAIPSRSIAIAAAVIADGDGRILIGEEVSYVLIYATGRETERGRDGD